MMEARGHRGTTLLLEGKRPRAELLKALLATHTERVYVDKKDGRSVQIGYIVRGEWFTLYQLTPWEKEA